jgi:ABC-type lipoprotein release transport system permease subunit
VGSVAIIAGSFSAFPFVLSLNVASLVLLAGALTGLIASLGPARRAAAGSPALNARV